MIKIIGKFKRKIESSIDMNKPLITLRFLQLLQPISIHISSELEST